MTVDDATAALYKHIAWNLSAVRCDGSFPNVVPQKQVDDLIKSVMAETVDTIKEITGSPNRQQKGGGN